MLRLRSLPVRARFPSVRMYSSSRVDLWHAEQARQLAARPPGPAGPAARLTVRPTSYSLEYIPGVTTPLDLAGEAGAAKGAVVAKVDGVLRDLRAPFQEGDESVEFCGTADEDGQSVVWHSAAHLLGHALELHFPGAKLCDGPPLEEGGFFYDCVLPEGGEVSEADLAALGKLMLQLARKGNGAFERLEVSRGFAETMFKDNPHKLDMLAKIPEKCISLYKCGEFVDMCRGPHVPDVAMIKSAKVTRVARVHATDEATDASVHRVYGIAFDAKKGVKQWDAFLKLAKERDHRVVGKKQELFMFHPHSPGGLFLLPHGMRICNTLVDFIKEEYRSRGFDEVSTPLLYKKELWETSGHWENYKEDMFTVTGAIPGDGEEAQELALKPMNCPAHCLIFDSRLRSHRELPLRFADFSPLHRNEATGALSGLTRLRRFHQDDAHIFCAAKDVQSEIRACLSFVEHVYSIFGFNFSVKLSTRPEKYLGELSAWEQAEDALRESLEEFGHPWSINKGDGAFYGPKVDITVTDALRRRHQCATIQLDFQLPRNFELSFMNNDDEAERPILIHRAALGSLERMLAVLCEHTGGDWPLWLSPRQCVVTTINEDVEEYGAALVSRLTAEGIYADLDSSSNTLSKKIKNAQLARYNYVLVVGNQEKDAQTVNVRKRGSPGIDGTYPVDEFVSRILAEVKEGRNRPACPP